MGRLTEVPALSRATCKYVRKIPDVRFEAWGVRVVIDRRVGLRGDTLYSPGIGEARKAIEKLGFKELQIKTNFDLLNLVFISKGIEEALIKFKLSTKFLSGWILRISDAEVPLGRMNIIDKRLKILTFAANAGKDGIIPEVILR